MKRSEVEDPDNGFRYFVDDAGENAPHLKVCSDVLDADRVCTSEKCPCGCHWDGGDSDPGPHPFLASFIL